MGQMAEYAYEQVESEYIELWERYNTDPEYRSLINSMPSELPIRGI